MQRVPVRSSNVLSVGYSATTLDLEVEFTSGGVFVYKQVSAETYARMMSLGTSIGRYVFSVVKPNHDCERVSG